MIISVCAPEINNVKLRTATIGADCSIGVGHLIFDARFEAIVKFVDSIGSVNSSEDTVTFLACVEFVEFVFPMPL